MPLEGSHLSGASPAAHAQTGPSAKRLFKAEGRLRSRHRSIDFGSRASAARRGYGPAARWHRPASLEPPARCAGRLPRARFGTGRLSRVLGPQTSLSVGGSTRGGRSRCRPRSAPAPLAAGRRGRPGNFRRTTTGVGRRAVGPQPPPPTAHTSGPRRRSSRCWPPTRRSSRRPPESGASCGRRSGVRVALSRRSTARTASCSAR